MKNLVIFLLIPCLLGSLTAAFGQEKPKPNPLSKLSLDKTLALGDSAFLVIKTNEQERPNLLGVQYVKLKGEKTEKFQQLISLKRRGVDGQLESSFIYKGQLVVLYSLYYPGPKRNHLLCDIYALPSLEKLQSHFIDEAYTPGLYRIPFGFDISPDSTKIMFYSWSYALPTDPAKMTLHVMDQNFNRIWKQRYVMPYKNETLYIYGCEVTNDGNVFILGEDYQGKITQNLNVDLKKVKRFALFVEQGNRDFLEYAINLKDDHVVAEMKFVMDKQNNLIGAGYFKKGRKIANDGFFTYKIDYTTKKPDLDKIFYSKEAYDQAYPYAEKEGTFSFHKRTFQSYFVDQIFVSPDGTIKIIGEQQAWGSNSPNTMAFNNVEYSDVMVTAIQDGKLKWNTRLPKRQSQVYTGESNPIFSYGLLEGKESLFIVFNDNIKNHESKENKNMKGFEYFIDGVSMLFEIGSNGALKKYSLKPYLKWQGANQLVVPKISWNLDQNTFMVYVESNRVLDALGRFIKISKSDLEAIHQSE